MGEFHKEKKGLAGLRAECKVCVRDRSKQYYNENTSERKIYNDQYRLEHNTAIKVYRKVYCQRPEAKVRNRKNQAQWATKMGDCYMIKLLRQSKQIKAIKPCDIPDYLIKRKRDDIKLLRFIKKAKARIKEIIELEKTVTERE